MSVSDRALQVDNRKRHDAACREIRKHLSSFLIVGDQLLIIRDAGIYLETHKTLAAFVDAEFGLEKSYAYRLINAATVKANLSPNGRQSLPNLPPSLPENERQFREVAKAPPDQQAEVVRKAMEKAAEENRKPTAKDYKQAVKLVIGELVDDDIEPIAKPPSGSSITQEDQAKSNRKLAKDYIAKAVNAVDDYHAVKQNKQKRAEIVTLLQRAGELLW